MELFKVLIDNITEDQEHQRASPVKKEHYKVFAKRPTNL